MKKKVVLLIMILSLIIVGSGIFYYKLYGFDYIGYGEKNDICLIEDYENEIEEYSDIINYRVDEIYDNESAISVGRKLFAEQYGEEYSKKLFKSSYDEHSKTWLVSKGARGYYTCGCTAHTIIDEDGNVLAIWHSK